jgi:GNAT superfamily N-acetyltransferase
MLDMSVLPLQGKLRKRAPPTFCSVEPFNLSLTQFLSGHADRKLDIDRIFGKSLDIVLDNYPPCRLMRGRITAAVFGRGYVFRTVETDTDAGVVLLDKGKTIVGAYLGCALAVLPEHRGHGLGAELVFEFALTYGVLPAWFLDVPAYSPAGFAAHCRAWHLARSISFSTRKGLRRARQGQIFDI